MIDLRNSFVLWNNYFFASVFNEHNVVLTGSTINNFHLKKSDCRYIKLINVEIIVLSEKDQLLEIHLLEKTARHQNLDCSTLFEQMPKKIKLLEKPQKSHFKQMQVLEQKVNCSNCNCSTKTLKNVNCSNSKKLKVWNMYGSSIKKQSKLG